MEDSQVFVGIDVSGAHLDVASRPTGDVWQVANDADGISALTQQLTGMSPSLVVLEATGGLEWALTAELAAAGLPAAVRGRGDVASVLIVPDNPLRGVNVGLPAQVSFPLNWRSAMFPLSSLLE